LAETVWKHN